MRLKFCYIRSETIKRSIDDAHDLNKEIEIAVCETAQTENDETTYLLQSPANKKRLLQAVENIENNRGLVVTNLDELS